jgi:hypothetical protein
LKIALTRDYKETVVARIKRDRKFARSRAQALRPLLTNPNLKVFSTLVMDAATARDLLK